MLSKIEVAASLRSRTKYLQYCFQLISKGEEMLHDPSHKPVMPVSREIVLEQDEREVLRALAQKLAGYASEPVNKVRAEEWRKLNDLEPTRPLVWINEIPWHEMNVDAELTLRTRDPWARKQEEELRRKIYQWEHLQGDMVLDDFMPCEKAIYSSDFGILEEVEVARTDDANDIYSRHFKIQIEEPEDIEKIQMPRVFHNEEATEMAFALMQDLYGDIMPVRLVGQKHIWYTPWDYLIRWWGVQEAMMDMVLRPDMVNAAVERMTDAWMVELDQFEELNLLSLDCNNTRIGSGGYGYTSGMPGEDYDESRIRPGNMWGCSNAQIFSEISPDMHWEFAIRHDLRWLERWKYTYYGCCEQLDNKMELLRRIPNLRKVSVSPWCNTGNMIKNVGSDYVMSRKPNPAVLATEKFNEKRAEEELREFLDPARGLAVELIMKDISTVRYEPQRLWKWAEIATRVAAEYAP